MNSDAMNTKQPQESFGSGASEAPAARSAELRSLYTPGPWEVAYHDANGQAVVKAKYFEIATCWHHCVGSIEREMEVNARLIAAAPDLLDALLEALEFIEDHADVSDGPDGSLRPNRAMQLCEPIRAALAKAGVKP
jgi:hypothetical protein